MPDDRTLAVEAAQAAGELALGYFGGAVETWEKGPNNPVCEADLALDRLLHERLLGARPAYGWLSEETADDAERLGRRRLWVVDPIDGTRDFLRGRTGWAVSVALVEDGVPILAALYAPARQQFFVAEAGKGATLNGAPIRIGGCDSVAGCRIPADISTIGASYWPERWDAAAVEKPNGLALRIAKLAIDEADAFFEGRPMGEWDIAAAALILSEAGGTITDREGAPLRFNKPVPRLRGVIAAVPAIHGEVLRRVGRGIAAINALRRPGGPGAGRSRSSGSDPSRP
ncbi:3'(2'),5'-bisphosphate nucleotidase CysQ [Sphingoaurantiacus capsulatus]|uniref:3'(2'),5'-bisphosphate nucleotidase CysQ n=1 Tax=Sphingoaurantiacus capsulatus TaxID=1771310 RepID=A0ABV7X7F2_9SPHN